MRRAQLIGLAVIVVASGLWATPAAGQTSEPWVLWEVVETVALVRDTGEPFEGNGKLYEPVTGVPDYSTCITAMETWFSDQEQAYSLVGPTQVTTLASQKVITVDLSDLGFLGTSATTFRCFPSSVDPRPTFFNASQSANTQTGDATSNGQPLPPLSPERLKQELLLRMLGGDPDIR